MRRFSSQGWQDAFVEFFRPQREPPGERPSPPPRPPWIAPPDDWLPGLVPLQVLLALTDEVAVIVRGAAVWPSGVELAVLLILRHRAAPGDSPVPLRQLHTRFSGGPVDENGFRFGVRFADGRRATTNDPLPFPRMPAAASTGEHPWA